MRCFNSSTRHTNRDEQVKYEEDEGNNAGGRVTCRAQGCENRPTGRTSFCWEHWSAARQCQKPGCDKLSQVFPVQLGSSLFRRCDVRSSVRCSTVAFARAVVRCAVCGDPTYFPHRASTVTTLRAFIRTTVHQPRYMDLVLSMMYDGVDISCCSWPLMCGGSGA